MRQTASRPRLRRRGLLAAAVLIALCATLLPAAVAAAASSPSPSPSPEPSPATTVSCELSPTTVIFGDTVTVSGVVTPAVAGQDVAVTLAGVHAATAVTDASGAYSATVAPRSSGDVVARLLADGTQSAAQRLTVKPKVTVTHGTAIPFLSLQYVVKVEPSTYGGTISAVVVHRGARVATVKAAVRGGKAVLQVPLRGVDTFVVTLSLPAADGLGARRLESTVRAKGERVATGSSGPRVRGLLTALSRLHIRVPYIGTIFNSQCADAVMAFQKAYRLPRTYVFDGDDWRKLDGAKPVKPRYSGPSTHIEVDKGRQILMVVKNGAVYGLIAVSTGATGNTPEGSFHIQQKHPYTTSGYGGILFRTMGFVGNFAIHGYAPVPPYPASHGCIREPMWVAAWTYGQSWVGERLYVYH
jgi:peptidoglycan hydrolase-like protein with peptidoglycan-binding domain